MPMITTLRGRFLLVVAAALVPLVGLFLLGRHRLTERAQEEWREDALRLAETAAASHVEVLREAEWVLRALRNAPAVRSPSPGVCESLFREFYESREHYTVFGIVGPDAVTACTYPSAPPMDLSERRYLRSALEERRLAVSDYHIGRISGRPVVTMALPVLGPDSAVVMVLAAGMDLHGVQHLPPDVEIPAGAHLTLFDRRGRVLYHAPDSMPRLGDTIPPALLRMARSVSDDTVAEAEMPSGGPRTFAIASVEMESADLGAYVAVSFDPAGVAAQIAEAGRSGLVGVALAALLLAVGVWLAVEFLVLRRVAPIVAASERLGRGEEGARSGVGAGDDELSRLGRAFDEMAENLERARRIEAERAERQVARSEERLRLLAETIDEVFWIWDPGEGRYLYLSPAFEEIWGIPADDLMRDARVWLERMHPDDRDRVRSRMIDEGVMREGEHEYRIVRPDGEVRWILSRTFAVRDEKGEPERYLGVAQDVTERKALEDALLQATKLEAVGRLAGGVAHDFNNVLTAIQGHTQFMEESLAPDHPAREDLAEIEVGVKRAAGLTRQLLTFSRKQAVRPTTLDVNEVVRDTVTMLRRLIGEDVELEIELAEGVPPVKADLHQIEQVLVNLSVNARDAMPAGGRLIIATEVVRPQEAEALSSDVLQAGEYALLRVTDTGHGMGPEVVEHVFEPFFTTKPVGEGTGLGLATVYGIAKQSGGAVEVSSEEGEGATFFVYLPAAGTPEEGTDDGEPRAEAPAGGHTVLLVEDEESVRVVVERMLRRLGCEVRTASSADEALAMRTGPEEVDVLVTDVVMPGMNGVDLHRRLQDRGREIPVVFMSGYPGFGIDDDALARRHVFLQKPFTSRELCEALEQALASAEQVG